jgi:uncharacterized repeat protein (TIGR03803 family)
MRTFAFGRYALTSCAAAALLAGCGGSQPLISAPSQSRVATPSGTVHHKTSPRQKTGIVETVIYSFSGGSRSMADGNDPRAGLLNVNGTLYGTTYLGGAYGLRHDFHGFGTVFSVTLSGSETVLHRFDGDGDGKYPYAADLIDVDGTLYGTTKGGGISHGTVFSITPSGSEKVLHSFKGRDGATPEAGLVDVKGTLYGTTLAGGKHQEGTVFAITSSGTETVLHSFGGVGDGGAPSAGLINVNGTLYGTTLQRLESTYGTVFSITRSGKEAILHSFKGGSEDGGYPEAGLVDMNGTLYGTTYGAGAYGAGTVFSITRSGKETLVHSFGASGDGAEPQAGLIGVNGTLYGTTVYGGANGKNDGTVFSITPSGTEAVLHSFGGSEDGSRPQADLLDLNGTLYGTTVFGGANNDGTIYSLTGI